ncbi:MAG: hypothetical protein JW709_07510 [Sedimentisphaerales bacterium]|nr:hypothetical protein [Sedimentisphaerales bacterium]
MNISPDEAQNSLQQIENTIKRTRRSLSAIGSGEILILWGGIWICSYLLTHFSLTQPQRIKIIWSVMGSLGAVGTIFIGLWSHRHSPVKSDEITRLGRKVFIFWLLLFTYLGVWLHVLTPQNIHGIQINIFMITGIMFAYIVLGLWLDEKYLFWLGLAVTAFALTGYYLIPPTYFNLWMAPTCGGAMLGTGLFIRRYWR